MNKSSICYVLYFCQSFDVHDYILSVWKEIIYYIPNDTKLIMNDISEYHLD